MLLQQSTVQGSVQLYIDKYILASLVSLVLGVCLSAVVRCIHCIYHAPANSFTFSAWNRNGPSSEITRLLLLPTGLDPIVCLVI